MIEVGFTAKMQTRFFDRGLADAMDDATRVSLAISGKAVMTTARRLLKGPIQMPLSEMSEEQLAIYRAAQLDFKIGKRRLPPRRPDKVSKPGKPPLLHEENSRLKRLLWFAVAEGQLSVVIGPEKFKPPKRQKTWGLRSIEELEKVRPFMAPALEKVTPKIPGYVEKAFREYRIKG